MYFFVHCELHLNVNPATHGLTLKASLHHLLLDEHTHCPFNITANDVVVL